MSRWSFLIVGVAVACSTTTPPTSNPATDDGQLGAITSDELLGTLVYGQTSAPITYVNPPQYRGLSFSGHVGDIVDIVVHTTDGVAKVWLQDSATATVDYDFASVNDAHLHDTLPLSGTYVIAFREASLKPATFTVSLSEAPTSDGGADSPDDVSADTSPEDAPNDSADDAGDASDAAVPTASCTYTLSLTGANGCSLCTLPQPATSTDALTVVIDNAGGGQKDMQAGGGLGRTFHMNGVGAELSQLGCSSTLALDGVPPSETWLVTNQGTSAFCPTYLVGSMNASINVANGNAVTISYSATASPGVQNCAIIHGCVSASVSCSGTTTAVQQ